ncbi:1,4-dihydroxy-2-naphthoate octaprenyltransferase [Methanocalculus alkaliphilus]|uniref:prenyltransferase n=1 Tax=Methanocalculus alkaliphilus TaxID=768730 RepID=UPI00209D5D33|nr:prenyltransferase [Methanocalculus alkaliphilus]MCP1715978.1 1,4-dihydroxy-2-naphthoate octaprenyltransferase [Methanocalculus alkaliphilus]
MINYKAGSDALLIMKQEVRSGSEPGISVSAIVDLVRIGRPQFLVAGFFLFLLGALFSLSTGGIFSPERFLWGYAVVAAAHLSVSYSNEYYDRSSDDPAVRSPVSGGTGILPVRPHLAGYALGAAILLSGASFLLAIGFVTAFSWNPLFIPFVLGGIFLSWAYSAPPLRFCSRGLGEVATLLAFGFFLPASGYFVMAGTISGGFLLFSIPLLFLGLFFILSVELPDREVDLRSGKRNIVTRFGRRRARQIIAGAGAAASLCYLGYALAGGVSVSFPAGWFLIPALLPLAAGIAGLISSTEERAAVGREAGMNLGALVVCILGGCLILIGM